MSDNSHTVTLANDNLYLSAEIFDIYFPGIQNVILLHKDTQILIMPVRQQGAGGLLAKIKNARGDRVVHGTKFFQSIGFDTSETMTLPVQWHSAEAALVFSLP